MQKFGLSADNYEANRHYFLNLYHQQHYDSAMSTLPVVNSTRYITRIEVWITNRTNNTENTRNIIVDILTFCASKEFQENFITENPNINIGKDIFNNWNDN